MSSLAYNTIRTGSWRGEGGGEPSRDPGVSRQDAPHHSVTEVFPAARPRAAATQSLKLVPPSPLAMFIASL